MSVHTDMFYMAVPFQRPELHGVVRAAMAFPDVDSVAARLRLVVFVAGLLGLGLAVCISGIRALTSRCGPAQPGAQREARDQRR
jgi:hypothetical protein